jgi:pSer/pThr/pTyr-binding forkhead associated (FHA) protein
MKLSLVVLAPGKSEGQKVPIAQKEFLIGRDPQCQLRPVSPIISKRHCVLIQRGDQVFIRDLKSTNGTFVNDQQIEGELEIKHGDKLSVGPLTLGIHLEGAPPVDKRTPVPPTKLHSEEDEHAAALLLALQDEVSTINETVNGDGPELATGVTILDSSPLANGNGADPTNGKQEASKLEQVKKAQADTSSAASRILDKYIRRPRM